ncbi:unnamed protein product [Triticum turgidum subsp. durum]|uniref:Uncharacterized protein n=1 Tax=Triticum turgidum subsp. durum TaxID=4567 RepID=A0A9R0S4H3_TRITD|nr:unnamed protein product [Triticum turgidum subsp. durum]
MGNCQAADAAAVVIQHPASGRTELAYWSLPAGEVMAANPGHYVAAVITAPHAASSEGPGGAPPVKHLKLLRPDDTLLLGRVYRLVSFEGVTNEIFSIDWCCAAIDRAEVLKEFATKRHVKLSRVMVKAKDEIMRQSVGEEEAAAAPSSGRVPKAGTNDNNGVAASEPGLDDDDDDCDLESLLPPGLALGRRLGRQWRPALQSIAEGRD